MTFDLPDLTITIESLQDSISRLDRRLAVIEAQSPGKIRTNHPYIVRVQGVCGGRPIIEGTRISVKTIVGLVKLGTAPTQIAAGYPVLSLAQIADALAYYEDHPEEIEAEFAEESRLLDEDVPRLQQLVEAGRQ